MSLLGDHLPSRISASRLTIIRSLCLADSLTVNGKSCTIFIMAVIAIRKSAITRLDLMSEFKERIK